MDLEDFVTSSKKGKPFPKRKVFLGHDTFRLINTLQESRLLVAGHDRNRLKCVLDKQVY